MSITIFLIRHAPHDEVGRRLTGRAPGHELTETGKAMAERLARRFDGVPVAAIHASPLDRTQQTAAAIAARTGVPVDTVDALIEIDFGEWTGASFEALDRDPRWHDWNAHRAAGRCPGGEEMAAAQTRIVDHLFATARAASRAAGAIVMVTHCDMIRAAVAQLLGLSLDHVHRFDVAPASITEIVIDADQARLVSLNERIALCRAKIPSLPINRPIERRCATGSRRSAHGSRISISATGCRPRPIISWAIIPHSNSRVSPMHCPPI